MVRRVVLVAVFVAGCAESARTAPVVPVETVVVPPAPPAQPAALPPPDAPRPTGGEAPTTLTLVPLEDGPSPSPNAACAPFDRAAAATALGSVNVQACARPGGIRGAGHVRLTYAPSGQVTAVVVDGGPFPGTPEAACIAAKFRAAQVPAFCVGAPVSIGKSFVVN